MDEYMYMCELLWSFSSQRVIMYVCMYEYVSLIKCYPITVASGLMVRLGLGYVFMRIKYY